MGTPKVEIIVKMVHDHEVNRARHCPQDAFLIATKSPSADVLVYNWSKHPSKPKDPSVCIPQVRCKGHEKEGYGLSWSPFEKGKLVSAGDDGLVCLFDAENGPAQPGSDSAIAAAPSNSMTAGGKGGLGCLLHLLLWMVWCLRRRCIRAERRCCGRLASQRRRRH